MTSQLVSSPAVIESAATSSANASYVLSLGKDRKAIVATLVALGDSKAVAAQTYDAAHKARVFEQTENLRNSLASGSVVLKQTRLKDGSLSVKIADGETLALAKAKVAARYAALAAKAMAKLK